MKRRRDLSNLISFLRKQGVTHYSTPELSITLGPIDSKPTEAPQPVTKEEKSVPRYSDEDMLMWSVENGRAARG